MKRTLFALSVLFVVATVSHGAMVLDVDFDAYVVPEPSTLTLLLAAALPFAAAACRSAGWRSWVTL